MKHRPTVRAWVSAVVAALATAFMGMPANAGSLDGSYTAQSCTAGCVAGSTTWSTNCAGTYTAIVAGATKSVTNTNAGYTGSVTLTCNAGGAGTVAQSSLVCTGNVCNLPWGGTTASGTSVTAYLSATPSGACTSQSRTCTAGTLSGTYTAQTCTAGCASATTAMWNTNCQGTAAAAAAGGTQSVTNTVGGYTGSATATCNAGGSGAFALSATSCAAAGACNLPWGGTIANAASVTAYLSATPAGACTSQSRTCTSGTLSGTYTAQTCTAGCASATTALWNTNCQGTATAAVAAGTQSVTNTKAGYTGSATATCNAGGSGAFALSATSCSAAASCGVVTKSWTTDLSCSKATTAAAHGAVQGLAVSTTVKDGYCQVTCSNGTWSACAAGYYCVSAGGSSSCSTC